jgi:parallel beta-helix repeat protein
MSSQKTQLWYNPSDFSVQPTASGFIDTIFFRSAVANQTTTYDTLRISMKQPDAGPGFTAGFVTGMTPVYDSAATINGAVVQGNWFYIKLSTPFRYNPAKPLVVEIITEGYSGTGLDTYGSNAGSVYKKLFAIPSSSVGGSPGNSSWQDFGLHLTFPPCTFPLSAGNATIMNNILCTGDTAQVDLVNDIIGDGQTYQWQTSVSPAGPWTNVGSAQLNSTFNHVPQSSVYYRAEITCSGNSAYSTPVLVNVQPITTGNYTINKLLPTMQHNFNSFSEAIRGLRCGITGPVTFDVIPGSGPYNEQVEFLPVPNASSTNFIRFNGNGETLSFASNYTGAKAAITLSGADHMTFDSLVVDVSAGTYGWGIFMKNYADSNTIRNCRIIASKTSTIAENHAGIVIKSPVDQSNRYMGANYNLFENNTISGGYYNISFTGATPDSCCSYVNGNRVLKNKFLDAYAAGIYLLGCKRMTISGNEISRPTRVNIAPTWSGLELSYSFAMLFENNSIHHAFDNTDANTTTSFTGINVLNSSTVSAITGPTIIRNNIIHNIRTKYSMTGIAVGGGNINVYHNTVMLNDTAATSAGNAFAFSHIDNPAASVFNNIFYVKRSGAGTKGIYSITTTFITTPNINNNVLYLQASGGTNYMGRYKTTNYTTFQDWKTANGGTFDQQSVNTDPDFFSEQLLIPLAAAVQDTGAALGVLTDINGLPRSSSKPDPGSYEVQKIYVFTGNGDWSNPANWLNNEIPPDLLPPAHHIIINPSAGGSCTFTGTLTISQGAAIKVMQGVNFIVNGNLVIL